MFMQPAWEVRTSCWWPVPREAHWLWRVCCALFCGWLSGSVVCWVWVVSFILSGVRGSAGFDGAGLGG